jgi:hypothetical protein
MTTPLKGMPNTKDAWKAHMETTTGQKTVDLSRADKLGLDQATIDKLHKADANGDGHLDWDEAWKAFDSFDGNGDAGSVDLDKLGKSDKAAAFAQGLTTLAGANQTANAARAVGGFDPTVAHIYTVDGRTIEFPPDALAKPAVVDKDNLGRPTLSFQLTDGTDGRLTKDPTKGWLATIDGKDYVAELGTTGKVVIKGVLTDDPKNKLVEGHAFSIKVGSGTPTYFANDRATSYTLDPTGKVVMKNGAPGTASIEAEGASRFETAWIGAGNQTMEYTTHFKDGRQTALRWSGKNDYAVRGEGGTWNKLDVPADRQLYSKLTVRPDGSVMAETYPKMGEGVKVDVYDKEGKLTKTLDYSTDAERSQRKSEGVAAAKAGDLSGVDVTNKAYQQQIEHSLLVTSGSDYSKGWQDRALATEYGTRMGKAVRELAAAGKLAEAKALQKKVVDELLGGEAPFTDATAKRMALDAMTAEVVAAGEPIASTLLPELGAAAQAHKASEPSNVFISDKTYQAIDALAQKELAAGRPDAAKKLYDAAGSFVTTETKNLGGYKSGDKYHVLTGSGGTIALDDPPSGIAVKGYDGLATSNAAVARMKSQQLAFAETWKKEVTSLPGLKLTDAEKNQVPPSPEVMKKYFAAKYDGQMPAKMEAMRTELDAYMKVAYAHPQLNTPDDVKGWTSAGLPTLKDGRLAADCFVTNRAVAHMLSGVSGLKMSVAQNDGHTRLVVTSTDGSQGFVQSNSNTAKLEGKATDGLQSRVERTIAKSAGLQVMYGLASPLRVGASFDTGAGLTDVDAAFDKSFAASDKALADINPASADGKLRAGALKVRDVVHKYEDFKARSNALARRWIEGPVTEDLKKEKAALAAERTTLDKELASVRGQVPAEHLRFIDAQKKGGVFDLSSGDEFFANRPFILSGNELYGTGKSSW